jgi:site-specific DNA recombinase
VALSRTEVSALVSDLGEIGGVIRQAEPEAKRMLYSQLDLRLDFEPETNTVRASVDLGAHRRRMVRVRRGT